MSKINLKVEEYHLIKDEIKVKQKRLEEIEKELDHYLEAQGIKKLSTPAGYTYSVNEVGPTYGVDQSLWEYLREIGVGHEEVCVGTIDHDKLVPMILDGKVDPEVVFKHVKEIRKPYKRHSIGKEKE